MRRAVIRLLCLLSVVCWMSWSPARSCAQSCHAPMLVAPRALGVRLALETQAASYDNERYRGEYQGVAGAATWTFRALQLYARLPYYRLVRNGLATDGLGDVNGAVRVRVLHDETDALRAGLALAATFPTGDPDRDLGMGHVMLTPGVFVAFTQGAYTGEWLVTYAQALSGSGAHAHHARGDAPIVNPMNRNEVQSAFAFVRELHPLASLLVGAFAAVPVAQKDGTPRAFANAGMRLHHEWLDTSFEAALPLAGDPFTLRFTLALGASF